MSRLIILASQSLQRQEVLAATGLEFVVLPADIDEKSIDNSDHAVRAAQVALAKAQKIATQEPQAIVIAADTFLVLDGERLEKPANLTEARLMLHKMSGRTVAVYTGWAVLYQPEAAIANSTTVDQVTFRTLSDSEIEKYVTGYPVTKWAGAFTISHMPGIALLAQIRGSITSVLGLPIEEILPYLAQLGIKL